MVMGKLGREWVVAWLGACDGAWVHGGGGVVMCGGGCLNWRNW